jgi:hypothetical protein
MKRVEWDTLMFFYGIMLCVGGLGALGYLAALSDFLYGDMGATTANILIGVLSAVIDNIPVMFAVLSMNPDMSLGQWLLVTLTAGVGGSLLSIGSAAGVALMGQARGIYTFSAHLKWIWAIALGYAASIAVHIVMKSALLIPAQRNRSLSDARSKTALVLSDFSTDRCAQENGQTGVLVTEAVRGVIRCWMAVDLALP